MSSFGEARHHTSDRRTVYEGGAKLFRIGSDALACISANNARSAIEFVTTLQRVYAPERDLPTLLRDTARNNLGAESRADFCVLIGRSYSTGAPPQLLRWSSARPDDVAEGDTFVEGSLPAHDKSVVLDLLRDIIANGPPDDRALIAMLGFMQSLGIRIQLLAVGIGGLFYGALSRAGRFSWQEDTLYNFLSPVEIESMRFGPAMSASEAKDAVGTLRRMGMAFLKIRDDFVIVQSTFLNGGDFEILASGGTPGELEAWIHQNFDPIRDEFERKESRYLMLFRTAGPNNIFVIDRNSKTAGNWLRVHVTGPKNAVFSLNRGVFEFLKSPHPSDFSEDRPMLKFI